jgi:hypothetical protein
MVKDLSRKSLVDIIPKQCPHHSYGIVSTRVLLQEVTGDIYDSVNAIGI